MCISSEVARANMNSKQLDENQFDSCGQSIVMKFGGSSLKNADRLRTVVELIAREYNQGPGHHPVVVLSAMGRTTSLLAAAAISAAETCKANIDPVIDSHTTVVNDLQIPSDWEERVSMYALLEQCQRILEGVSLIGELTPCTNDAVMSFGERMAVRVVAALLKSIGLRARAVDAYDIGMQTKGRQNGASDRERVAVEILPHSMSRIRAALGVDISAGVIPVITGFIAKNEANKISTLGRGGSDLTAVYIGSALQSREIQIWTDTNGVLTADPRLVPGAQTIPSLAYDVASELAYFGAKVLHPRSMHPAIASGVPIRVVNSYSPSCPGTLITTRLPLTSKGNNPGGCRSSASGVLALTLKAPVVLVDIRATHMLGQFGFLAHVFSVFASLELSVDVIATSEISVSMTLDRDTELERIRALPASLATVADVTIKDCMAIVALVGDRSRATDILSIACETLSDIGVSLEMISLGASKLNTSLVVPEQMAAAAVRALHSRFFRPE